MILSDEIEGEPSNGGSRYTQDRHQDTHNFAARHLGSVYAANVNDARGVCEETMRIVRHRTIAEKRGNGATRHLTQAHPYMVQIPRLSLTASTNSILVP